ncbi:MAG: amino acid adenylation domain-containing protein [Myxococcaceae bacterium]|nr:amino acid adenylation domain-containing protein [Myxococcaceae bacterium]
MSESKRAILEKALRNRQAGERPAGPRPIERRGDLPISTAQERLLYLEQLEPLGPSWWVTILVHLEGTLDRQALQRAYAALTARHEPLRTTFPEIQERFVQRVSPAAAPLEIEQLRPATLEQLHAKVLSVVGTGADVRVGPLVRARLYAFSPERHALLFSLHGALQDAWSLRLLVLELADHYARELAGQPSAAPGKLQYADYAAWERESAATRGDAGLEYFKRVLAAPPAAPDLALTRPAPGTETFEGRMLMPPPMPAALLAAVKAACRAEKTTPFAFLEAALAVLVGKLCRTSDVLIGTSVDTRTHPDLRDVVGCFENTLLLRTVWTGDPTFQEVLAQVRTRCLEAITHRETGIDRVVSAMRGERDAGRGFPTSIIYNYEEEIPDAVPFAGLSARLEPVMVGRSKFDLAVRVFELRATGELGARLHLRTDLFSEAEVLRLWARLRVLLEAVVREPRIRLSHLELASAEERAELAALARVRAPSPRARTLLHEAVRAQAMRAPDQVAVVTSDQELSYGDLIERADALSAALVKRGAGPGVPVGVFLERGVDWVVSVVATLQAGAIYVPLVPDFPAERLALVLRDSGTQLVITRGALWDKIPEPFDERAVRLEQVSWTVGFEPRPVSPDQVAYLIYTSGSTGAPKGVEVLHRGVANTIAAALDQFQGLGGQRALQFISPAFDASMNDLFWALAGGRTLCIAPPKCPGGVELEAFAIKHGVEHLNLPASVLATLRPEQLPKVVVVSSGGEACTPALVNRWRPQATFFNRYGPTETSVECTVGACELGHGVVPIGQPIAGAMVAVVGPDLRPVPLGAVGELVVGGAGVARGYRGQAALTAERFVPDPFPGAPPGARLYRTGDLVRQRSDGTLFFQGRADEQIKLRGLRIEPGEIEDVLRRTDGVEDAVVAVKTLAQGQAQLVAYFTGKPGAQVTLDALRAQLRTSLPAHMVPAILMQLDRLPRTHTGKVDRNALPVPTNDAPSEGGASGLTTNAERVVAEAVASLVGASSVSGQSNFFELGGDSLLSLQLVAKVARHGLSLSVADVLSRQTISGIAAAAKVTTASASAQVLDSRVPLTPIQRWFFTEHPLSDVPRYSQSLLLEFKGQVDVERLTRSLGTVVARHRALATRIHGLGEESASQELGARLRPPVVAVVDVSGVEGVEAQQRRLAEQTADVHDFDLQQGPLVKAVAVNRGSAAPGWVLLVVHHLVVDVVSWRVIVEDLEAAYASQGQAQEAPVGATTSDLSRWATGLAEFARSPALLEELPYWTQQPWSRAVTLPKELTGPMTKDSMRTVHATLDEGHTRALLRSAQARPHELLMTALAAACTGWAGGQVLQLDVEHHGREDVVPGLDLSRTVGWFTAYAPVLLDVGASSWAERLAEVRRANRAVPRNGLGYIVLKYLAEPSVRSAMAKLPPSAVCFNYMGVLDHALAESTLFTMAPGVEGPVDAARTRKDLLLEVNAGVAKGVLRTSFSFSAGAYSTATIEVLLRRYHASIEQLLDG